MTGERNGPSTASSILASVHTSGYALSLFRPAEAKVIAVFDQKVKPYLNIAATGEVRRTRAYRVVKQDFFLNATLARIGV